MVNIEPQGEASQVRSLGNGIIDEAFWWSADPLVNPLHLKPLRKGTPYYSLPRVKWDPWKTSLATAEKYDNNRCKGWKEGIDTLLVITGLFTAIVTAFTSESYQWLQPNSVDVNSQLLITISQQLVNTNATSALDASNINTFTPDSSAIRINCVWFASISLSLCSALIGIVGKQWVQEFQHSTAMSHEEAVSLRQMRFEGLEYWRVPQILHVPVLLLQASFFLFFVGLLDFLWFRLGCRVVALPATIGVGLATLFMTVTTLYPFIDLVLTSIIPVPTLRGFQPLCPYRSPQSWMVVKSGQMLVEWIRSMFTSDRSDGFLTRKSFSSWLDIDRGWINRSTYSDCDLTNYYRFTGVLWIMEKLSFDAASVRSAVCCLQEMLGRVPSTWQLACSFYASLDIHDYDVAMLDKLFAYAGSEDMECQIELLLRCPDAYTHLSWPRLASQLAQCSELGDTVKAALWHHIHVALEERGMDEFLASAILIAGLRHPTHAREPRTLTRRLRGFSRRGSATRVLTWQMDNNELQIVRQALSAFGPPSPEFVELYEVMLELHERFDRGKMEALREIILQSVPNGDSGEFNSRNSTRHSADDEALSLEPALYRMVETGRGVNNRMDIYSATYLPRYETLFASSDDKSYNSPGDSKESGGMNMRTVSPVESDTTRSLPSSPTLQAGTHYSTISSDPVSPQSDDTEHAIAESDSSVQYENNMAEAQDVYNYEPRGSETVIDHSMPLFPLRRRDTIDFSAPSSPISSHDGTISGRRVNLVTSALHRLFGHATSSSSNASIESYFIQGADPGV